MVVETLTYIFLKCIKTKRNCDSTASSFMKHKLSLVSCLTVKHVTGFTSEPYCGLTGRVAVCKNGSVSEKTMAAILQLSQNAEMEGSDWCMMWKISVYDTLQHELSD